MSKVGIKMSTDSSSPADSFAGDLRNVVEKWRKKPDDDSLIYREMLGAIEELKVQLVFELATINGWAVPPKSKK